jgi:L-alanine-DL-glutamate epimerase-like enolase superfamily enzyme
MDIHGYHRLKQNLRIPLMATEMTPGGLQELAHWIVSEATDYVRGDVVIKGGITGLMKIAHLGEAFNLPCEIHDGYNAMNNVANLHVAMAIDNCDWFEVLPFNRTGDYTLEHLSYGLAGFPVIDSHGDIHAPTGPGLGVDVDWELINASVTQVVS